MPTAAQIAEAVLTPSLPVFLIGLLILVGGPLLLHTILAASSTYTTAPTILLLGPDSAGKTALVTLLERGTKPAQTHTSQVVQAVELNATTDASTKGSFRNHADATGTYTKFLLVDTPGHGKLRNLAMGKLSRTERLKGVVFMVDAAALGERERDGAASGGGGGGLAATAEYLYDVLLHLQQKRARGRGSGSGSGSGSGKGRNNAAVLPVLVAANKMDLFTALPANLVRAQLERELSRIRASRSKGLLDSGVGVDEIGSEEQDAWLGEYGSDKFTFEQMVEFDIEVEVLGGSVTTDEADVDKWWWWMSSRV
ncbi:hypothetical protein E4U43_005828 [Claviceps pusilla]|uniref:Signal recognition particle receptor subunit beta n=1 Tax=Claviceps pusilla TaxID=123648 RepID=A0A9P7ST44_9HYPO|nr:hypothetical protein E4U43_005828 [Claviceps pusilla]